MNLGYNSLSLAQFTGIMRAAPLNTSQGLRRDASLNNRFGSLTGALANGTQAAVSTDTFVHTKSQDLQASKSHSGPWMARTRNEYFMNLDASKKGSFLGTGNLPNQEMNRDVYQGIGWGVNNKNIRHDLVNAQKERFPKPTLRHLDNAKCSNFINYLQSKRNEINHVKQDYAHPKMFYLTGNRSEVRNFQAVEKPIAPADVRKASEKKANAKSKQR